MKAKSLSRICLGLRLTEPAPVVLKYNARILAHFARRSPCISADWGNSVEERDAWMSEQGRELAAPSSRMPMIKIK